MSGPTPGPWRVNDVHPEAWTRQVWTDEGHGSVMIATVGGVDKEANAALIASAPALAAEVGRLRARVAQLEGVLEATAAMLEIEAKAHEDSGDEQRRKYAKHDRAQVCIARATLKVTP